MLSLRINNSTCQLLGLNAKQHKELAELLSYTLDPQAAYFSGAHRSPKRSLLTKRGEFPTGLLYIVNKWLKNKECLTNDIRRKPERRQGLFNLKLTHTPYPEQTDAAEACLEHSRGIVTAPTGSGKSLIIALIINYLQIKTLVVVPTLELKRQLTETLKELFGDSAKHVKVENVDALDPNRLEKGYDCVIIDEFHHSGAKTYRKLNRKAWSGVYYKFGLSATPFRSQDNERLLLESVLSKVIFRLDYKTAVEKGYIVPMEAYYYDVPEQEIKGNPFNWAAMYSELVVNNEKRNNIIMGIMDVLYHSGTSTLCLVKEIKHGETLEKEVMARFANGQDPMCRRWIENFNTGLNKMLIGTTGVLGEGVDTKPAEYIIIAGLGKSKNAFMQQCGRGFRRYPGKESCKIIIFRDISHKWTLAHFKAQCKILREEYGVKAVKL